MMNDVHYGVGCDYSDDCDYIGKKMAVVTVCHVVQHSKETYEEEIQCGLVSTNLLGGSFV